MKLATIRTVYAIGDVHGCAGMLLHLLLAILADAGPGVRPFVVLLGDYIDRGPNSKKVLDIISSPWFRSAFESICLRGNHEAMLFAALGNAEVAGKWLQSWGGAETIESYGVEFGMESDWTLVRRFGRAVDPAHLDLLATMATSYAEGPWFFSHAGIMPGVPFHQQRDEHLLWGHRDFYDDRRDHGLVCVHGHVIGAGVLDLGNRVAVDTGAGSDGGRLSAAVLGPDGSIRSLSVGPAAGYALDLDYPEAAFRPI